MKRLMGWMLLILLLLTGSALAQANETVAFRLVDEQGTYLAMLDITPTVGDWYIAADNTQYRVVAVQAQEAVLHAEGKVTLPDRSWQAETEAVSVLAAVRTLSLQSGEALRDDLTQQLKDALYGTGAALITSGTAAADITMTVLADHASDPGEYEALIRGESAGKLRLLLRRGTEEEEFLRQFALSLKRVLDEEAPTMCRDIYLSATLPEQMRLLYGAAQTETARLEHGVPVLAEAIAQALAESSASGSLSAQAVEGSMGAVTGVIFAGGLLLAGMIGYGLLLGTARRKHG